MSTIPSWTVTLDRKEEKKKKIDFQQNVNIKQQKQEEEIVTLFVNIAA